jgi:hypothetical protein
MMTTDEHVTLVSDVMTRSAAAALKKHRAALVAEGRPASEIEQRLTVYAEQLEQHKLERLAEIRIEDVLTQAVLAAHGVFKR